MSKRPLSTGGPASADVDGFVTVTGSSDVLFFFTIQCSIATTQPLLVVAAPADEAIFAIGRFGHRRGGTNRFGSVSDTIVP
jgi:hypothetical protein